MFLLWNFNLLHLIVIAVSGLAVTTANGLALIRQHGRSVIVRGVCSAAIVVTFLFIPAATTALIELRIDYFRQMGLGFVSVDAWPGYPLVALVGSVLVFATSRFFRKRDRLYLFCFGFPLANSIWGGNPNWYGRIGFPFSWYQFSDGIISFDGFTPSPWTPLAGIADGIIFLAILLTLLMVDRRGRPLALE